MPLPLIPEDDPNERLVFPRASRPRVSVIVPAHNAWRHTHLALRAILEHTSGPSYEVILAEDASTDGTTRASDLLVNASVLSDGVRRGFVANCNHAARAARGDYLLFLNNDTVVQPGWLAALVRTADRRPDAGIVGGKVVGEDGHVQEAGCMVFRDGGPAQYGRGGDPSDPAFNYVKEVDYVSGCCLLVRRRAWEELGGFDERFSPGYFEDVDLAFRARSAGYAVLYQPRGVVMHTEGVSHGRDPTSGIKRFLGVNAAVFRARWGPVLEREQADRRDVHLARDRSSRRNRILVVDHEVPQPDRDAGSRYVDTYLRLLLGLGYHVTFVSDLGEPVDPYAEDLCQAGVEVVWGLWTNEARSDWIRENGRYYDVAYLHRPFVAVGYLRALREHSDAKIIYSPVDLHFLRERRRWNLTGETAAHENASAYEHDELELLTGADVVHVVSAYEEELVRDMVPGARVRTLPIYVYDHPCEDVPDYDQRRHLMFVGGFMHPPNVDAARWFVDEVFPVVRREIPDVFLYLVGSHPPEEVRELGGDGVVVTGRVSERMLEDLYRQTRVVVCPLRYGAGAKGKLVEALHYGVPPVVTGVAAEGFPDIEQHVTVADSPTEMARAIVELYGDGSVWRLRSRAVLAYARMHFSLDAALRVLSADFEAAADRAGEGYDVPSSADASARRVASR
jgi:GT2 family glycosyltransferase